MLAELVDGAVADAAAREVERPLEAVRAAAAARPPARDALAALAPRETVHIIAEVKRSSPSRGEIAAIGDPARLAVSYEEAGASTISVLTEPRHFGGSLADLEAVREVVNVPVLRKDFISVPYQVYEARASGADIVLLIVAALEHEVLRELYGLVRELGMTALVETHSEDEIDRALDVGAELIGVNARDLTTFHLDRELFSRVADRLPSGVIRVAESAVRDVEDVARYRRSGADVVLVGEALVTSDPATALDEFLAV